MNAIFKALNDPHRRAILDALRERDGQTLTEIEGRFPLSRFGVMAHLRVLEEAGLVVPRRAGRFKHHYLNALPLQEVIDRWVEPLLKPTLRGVLDLKRNLERVPTMNTMTPMNTPVDAPSPINRPDFVHETFIRAAPERVWEALTTAALSRQYYLMGAAVEGEAVTGGRLVWRTPDGAALLSGDVLEASPFDRLDMTFEPHWGAGDRAPSRAVYLLSPEGPLTRLTIEHYGIPAGQEGIKEGWARIASGLKTLLETGRPLAA